MATATFSLLHSLVLRYLNAQREKEYGKPAKGMPVDVIDLINTNPHLQYTTEICNFQCYLTLL